RDDGQQIIEIMGHAARQLADRLQLLRLAIAFFELMAIGDVLGNAGDALQFAVAIANEEAAVPDPANGLIGPNDAIFGLEAVALNDLGEVAGHACAILGMNSVDPRG